MGIVYEAEEIDSGRRVALKVLEGRLDDERERERFARGGRLAASINHRHCVFVFAAFDVESRLAIAMELMGHAGRSRESARAAAAFVCHRRRAPARDGAPGVLRARHGPVSPRGLMRMLGLEIVTANGRQASRLRVVVRATLAWAPIIMLWAVSMDRGAHVPIAGPIEFAATSGVALLVQLAGAVAAMVRPARGIQDRLAGTWIVPR